VEAFPAVDYLTQSVTAVLRVTSVVALLFYHSSRVLLRPIRIIAGDDA